MKKVLLTTALALASCLTVAAAQTAPAPASDGLSELNAMTFGCPKAALNAAARRAANAPSQGTYQFAYFAIISDSHHAMYEVHFKSNYEGEADLKYCVAMSCQQGWDPKTAQTTVTLMSNGRSPMKGADHGGSCSQAPAPAKRPLKR